MREKGVPKAGFTKRPGGLRPGSGQAERRAATTFLVFALLSAGLSARTSYAGAQELPLCPLVHATLDATLDTKKVKPGDRFTFKTSEPIQAGDDAIPGGTEGAGIIAVMNHSRSQGQAGYLILDARSLRLADGRHVPVAMPPGTDGRSFAFIGAGSSNAPAILGYIPFFVGTAAGVYNFFHHGKDGALVAGTAFPLVVGDGVEDGTRRAQVIAPDINEPAPHF